MNLIILLVCVVLAQEESPGTSAPMQAELHIFPNIESDDEAGIFSTDEFKKGMGPMDQFFLKDMFETIISAIEGIADESNDAKFLQESNEDQQEVIQIQSPLLGLFNPLFTVFQPSDADFVEIETVSINGQTQTKVTKSTTKNGITTTTTEITTSNDSVPTEVSDDFILQENPVIEDAEKFVSEETIIPVNLDESITILAEETNPPVQELHVLQDNYTTTNQPMPLSVTIVGGVVLTALIGFGIKKLMK